MNGVWTLFIHSFIELNWNFQFSRRKKNENIDIVFILSWGLIWMEFFFCFNRCYLSFQFVVVVVVHHMISFELKKNFFQCFYSIVDYTWKPTTTKTTTTTNLVVMIGFSVIVKKKKWMNEMNKPWKEKGKKNSKLVVVGFSHDDFFMFVSVYGLMVWASW